MTLRTDLPPAEPSGDTAYWHVKGGGFEDFDTTEEGLEQTIALYEADQIPYTVQYLPAEVEDLSDVSVGW